MHQPLPLTLFTGFLGAGKTHVIQRVLHALEEEGERVLLVINDLSQDNMDAYAFHNPQQTQRAVESLSGGCVCCNLLGTLVETLVEAHRRCREDGAAAYTRVFVECTGVADPTPVAATLSSLPALDGVVEMEAVIAVVNARSLDADGSPLDRMAGSQLRGANIVLINQWEMVSGINPATMQQWCARLKAFGAEENPHMRVYATNSGFFAFCDLVRGAKLFEEDGSRAYFLRAYAATGKAVGDVGDAEEEAGELELLGARHFTYEASSSSSTTSLRRLRAQLTSPAGRGLFRHVWRSKGFFFAHDDEVEDGATIASKLHTRKQFRWQSVNRSVDYGEVLPPYVELRTPKDGLLDARIVFIGGFDAHKEEQVRAFFAEAQVRDGDGDAASL